jgi:hypothetical protein
MPFAYALANEDSCSRAVTANENWAIGWRSLGQRSMSSSTNLGTSERAAHSAERSRTCCSVGTSPVRRSQKIPSLFSTEVAPRGERGMGGGHLREVVRPRRELWVIVFDILESRGVSSHYPSDNAWSYPPIVTDRLSSEPDAFFRI